MSNSRCEGRVGIRLACSIPIMVVTSRLPRNHEGAMHIFLKAQGPATWHCRLAFNPVKKESFKEGVNPDGSAHSEWKARYYLVRTRSAL